MDTLTAAQRSLQMARIVGKNTKPELAVRSMVWRLGYRYRLHSPRIPGRPDLVFHGRRKVIFVHGCFWHQHPGCKLARLPKSRQEYWTPKLLGNCARDQRVRSELNAMGWQSLVVWECELQHPDEAARKIQEFLAMPSV